MFQFWENDLSFGEAEIFSICSKPPEKASAEFDHGYADKILLNSQVLNRLLLIIAAYIFTRIYEF